MTLFKGLTWDHPRGYNALAAAADDVRKATGSALIDWRKQPLEGFESHPIKDLADAHDLLVLDHPHLGEAAAYDRLLPLEEVFSSDEIEQWKKQSIGPAMESYIWQGHAYALPLDVATQVSVRRPDLCPNRPDSWADVLALAETGKVGLSLGGPHALLSFYSLCLSLGAEPGQDSLIDQSTGLEALGILQSLYAHLDKSLVLLNPIQLLETMSREDRLGYIPLIYGYVTYSTPGQRPFQLAFGEAPHAGQGRRGSVLGGTGIALTKRCAPNDKLLDHLRWLMREPTQSTFIPRHDGQPSALAAWADPEVNAAAGRFYLDTLETASTAWVRPRFDGYIAFQNAASGIVRQTLAGEFDHGAALDQIEIRWKHARSIARGPLA
ncbi:membrane protein [Kaistia sp. 32K]|uniref:extracellular solute-binding protein n=1 Tax=Kaistia sp. 32K TaxID=2795690 RepID=UPI0019167779|nr:extracellular solute-binding protein [Kaistia sp. 32K]BCP53965.1 membrane protein [Kaistia sp. 32K]